MLHVFQISDQKSLKSWSIRHGISLTSPVFWNSQLEKFVTVVNNQVLNFLYFLPKIKVLNTKVIFSTVTIFIPDQWSSALDDLSILI
jgi:hypothetical protein